MDKTVSKALTSALIVGDIIEYLSEHPAIGPALNNLPDPVFMSLVAEIDHLTTNRLDDV